MSAQRMRISAVPPLPPDDDFSEPDAELLSRVGEVVQPSVRAAKRDPELKRDLEERERTIDSLTHQLVAMQCEVEDARDALRARESELAELRKLVSLPPAPAAREVAPVAEPVIERVRVYFQRGSQAAELDVDFREETHFFAGLAEDLATGGLFIATYRPLPVGLRVALELTLADGRQICAWGVVAWIRDQRDATSERPGIGVLFDSPSVDALAVIREICRHRPALCVEV